MPASGTWIACNAGGVRLEIRARALAADHLAADAVGLAALEDVGSSAGELGFVDGDDHFAAELEGNPSAWQNAPSPACPRGS